MDSNHRSRDQTWDGKSIGDLLDGTTSRAKGRRGNIDSTVIVDHAADDGVYSGHHRLAE